jgi:hypothetical protein
MGWIVAIIVVPVLFAVVARGGRCAPPPAHGGVDDPSGIRAGGAATPLALARRCSLPLQSRTAPRREFVKAQGAALTACAAITGRRPTGE